MKRLPIWNYWEYGLLSLFGVILLSSAWARAEGDHLVTIPLPASLPKEGQIVGFRVDTHFGWICRVPSIPRGWKMIVINSSSSGDWISVTGTKNVGGDNLPIDTRYFENFLHIQKTEDPNDPFFIEASLQVAVNGRIRKFHFKEEDLILTPLLAPEEEEETAEESSSPGENGPLMDSPASSPP